MSVKIMLLGGVRENGKNLYAVETENEIFVLDMGLKYPDNELLGIDIVIPDFTYIEENIDKVAGIFLTHGHADAIGALPYFVQKYDVPVFGSELTIELAKINTKNYKNSRKFDDFHVIDSETAIDFQDATVSFFKTTHSIPGSLGVVVDTKEGQVVYTGDFKFDQSAVPMYQTDYHRISEVGRKKVIALLSDSTNSEMTGNAANEIDITNYIVDTFRYHSGRIIVASVASNIQRMQQVLHAAYKTQRKVVISGRDAEKIVRTAMKLGYLKLEDDDILIPEKDIDKYEDSELVIVETGKMGEPIKLLQKLANDKRSKIHIEPGDLVFITTTPSHAMETTVAKTRDMIYRAGAEVKMISSDMKSSGHANKNDLQLMINLLNPENLIPVQGEYRLLDAQADLAQETGMGKDHIYITQKGDALEYDPNERNFNNVQAVAAGDTMIDGIGVGDIGSVVLKDRQILAEDGVFIAVATIDRKKKKIISEPKVNARGFIYMKDNKELLSESVDLITKTIEEYFEQKEFDWSELKQKVRDALNRYLVDKTQRHPMILPVIMEINQNRHRSHK